MPGAYVCVLLRKFFVVASVTRFSELHLAVHGAVGFKAWINETKEASLLCCPARWGLTIHRWRRWRKLPAADPEAKSFIGASVAVPSWS
jgi:hypothetical protein